MKIFSANIVFTGITDPIENGIVITDDSGKIMDVINPAIYNETVSGIQKFEGYICPGFINTHCHLELSYLKNKIPQKLGLDGFIRHINQVRNFSKDEILEAIEKADLKMFGEGIVAVGDICNTDNTLKQKEKSKIQYHTFCETYSFNPDKAEIAFEKAKQNYNKFSNINKRVSITAHAPYSLSKRLFELISHFAKENNSLLSYHNQESNEENELYINKQGKTLERLTVWGIDYTHFIPTGKSSLISTLPFFSKKNNLLLVHNIYSNAEDIDFASRYSNLIWWCFCPNANIYIENKLPDISIFINKTVPITIGTDSLASNNELSILNEIITLQNNFPDISLVTLINLATINGARFLKMEDKIGSIEKGKKPGLNFIPQSNSSLCKLQENSKVQKLI